MWRFSVIQVIVIQITLIYCWICFKFLKKFHLPSTRIYFNVGFVISPLGFLFQCIFLPTQSSYIPNKLNSFTTSSPVWSFCKLQSETVELCCIIVTASNLSAISLYNAVKFKNTVIIQLNQYIWNCFKQKEDYHLYEEGITRTVGLDGFIF